MIDLASRCPCLSLHITDWLPGLSEFPLGRKHSSHRVDRCKGRLLCQLLWLSPESHRPKGCFAWDYLFVFSEEMVGAGKYVMFSGSDGTWRSGFQKLNSVFFCAIPIPAPCGCFTRFFGALFRKPKQIVAMVPHFKATRVDASFLGALLNLDAVWHPSLRSFPGSRRP